MRYIFILVFFLTSCASTTFYDKEGNKIATFQGNMRNMTYIQTADTIIWKSSDVNHEAATKAYGESSAGRISAGASIFYAVARFFK